MKFFTADWHFGSEAVLKLSRRKFKSIEHMDNFLIRKCNDAANETDTVYHVGDFISYKGSSNFKGTKNKPQHYIDKIKANLILFNGNHDMNNKVKPHLDFGIVKVGSLLCTIGHFPSRGDRTSDFPDDPTYYPFIRHSVHICGHVHDSWKYQHDEYNDILNINVGVDQWNMCPVSEINLFKFIIQLVKGHKSEYKYILKI